MKVIKAAWIEQILEFDSEAEYDAYADKLAQTGKMYSSDLTIDNISGKVIARVKKQYKNNAFPDEVKGSE